MGGGHGRAAVRARTVSRILVPSDFCNARIASPAALAIALQDFNDLLLTGKLPLKPPASSPDKRKKPAPEPYNRARYYRCAVDRRKAFGELYQFCFVLAKPP